MNAQSFFRIKGPWLQSWIRTPRNFETGEGPSLSRDFARQ